LLLKTYIKEIIARCNLLIKVPIFTINFLYQIKGESMSSVNTVIELGYGLGEDEQAKLKQLFDLVFNMNENEIKIYDAFNYSKQSDFARQVYDEIREVKSLSCEFDMGIYSESIKN